jgi:predicted nucleic-acid-binding protein
VAQVVRHLMTLPHVLIEDRPAIESAIALMAADNNALDFADALHHASYRECEAMATFDDRRFARRAQRLGLVPRVIVPR